MRILDIKIKNKKVVAFRDLGPGAGFIYQGACYLKVDLNCAASLKTGHIISVPQFEQVLKIKGIKVEV